MHDDAADILAINHVLVALIDVLKPVSSGDQFVQFEFAFLIHAHQPWDLEVWITRPEKSSLDGALELGE